MAVDKQEFLEAILVACRKVEESIPSWEGRLEEVQALGEDLRGYATADFVDMIGTVMAYYVHPDNPVQVGDLRR